MKTLRQDLILEDVEDSEGTSANAELRPRGVRLWSVWTRSGMLAQAQHTLNSPGKTGIAGLGLGPHTSPSLGISGSRRPLNVGKRKALPTRMLSDPLDLQEMAGDIFHLKSQRFDEAQMESSIQSCLG